MKSTNHPILLTVFLGLVGSGLGYLAVSSKARGEARIRADLNRAIAMGTDGDLESAVVALQKIAEARPDLTSAWFNLGVALGGLDRLDEAEKALEHVVEREPQDWDAVAELGGIEALRGHDEEAFKLLERIPPKEGGMQQRLDTPDRRWERILPDPRFSQLRVKHGLAPFESAPPVPPDAPPAIEPPSRGMVTKEDPLPSPSELPEHLQPLRELLPKGHPPIGGGRGPAGPSGNPHAAPRNPHAPH